MRILLHVLAVSLAASALGAEPSPYPLDLTSAHTLKEVFDAGLRPWRVQGLEPFKCMFEEATLTLALPESRPFDMSVAFADFSILDGNQIANVTFRGQQLSVQEAVAHTKRICDALGILPEGLDAAVASLPATPTPGKYWFVRMHNSQMRVQVTFDPLFFPDRLAAYVMLEINFQTPSQPIKLPSQPFQPLQPPTNYEHISMEPPTRKPSAKPIPEHSLDYYKNLIRKP